MSVLTDLQRKYVLAMSVNPFATPSEWARMAGYSQHSAGSRKAGHDCRRNPKVEAAVFEVAQAMLYTEGPMLAAAGLLAIAKNPNHGNHMRALETLANRVGLHETTEHHLTVTKTLTADEKMDRLLSLAKKHGLDPQLLLGGNSVSREARAGPVIEHEAKDG